MASKTGSVEIKKAVEKAEWEELFEFLDKDKSGEISYVEFITRIDDLDDGLENFQDLQEAMKMFRDGDDGDKKLTKAEFAKMMGVKFTEIKVMFAFLVVFLRMFMIFFCRKKRPKLQLMIKIGVKCLTLLMVTRMAA